MEELVHLLKLTQKELKIELYNDLKFLKMNPLYGDGFLYAKGKLPVLLVAHMDTVFDVPENIYSNKKEDIIYNQHGGLGGDDRCGIYIILKLLEQYRPHVLFTEDEEIGCVGAMKATKNLAAPDVKYIIEFDRKGKNDCVFYSCHNKKFIDYIESFGFIQNFGTFSDISVLGSRWDIAAVNLSCGYYHEHTPYEHIIFSETINTLNKAKNMLHASKKAPYFSYHTQDLDEDTEYKNNMFQRMLAYYYDEIHDYYTDHFTRNKNPKNKGGK